MVAGSVRRAPQAAAAVTRSNFRVFRLSRSCKNAYFAFETGYAHGHSRGRNYSDMWQHHKWTSIRRSRN